MTTLPPWMADLDEQDLTFVKRFLLASKNVSKGRTSPGQRLSRLERKI